MKKFFVLLLIIAAIVGLYFAGKSKAPAAKIDTKTTSYKADLSNLSFSTDDGPIALENGKGERANGTDLKDEFALTDIRATGDLNNDGQDDSAGFIIENSAGTGVFVYVAAAVSGNVTYKGTNAVFIGDRVEPTDISIANGTLTVKYLDRGPTEPFSADPSISTTKTLVYKNGELIEK
jgi:hypothetical protein